MTTNAYVKFVGINNGKPNDLAYLEGKHMRIILKEEILRLNCPGYGEQSTLSLGKARALETYKVLFVNPTSIMHLFDDGSDVLRQIEAAQSEGLTSYALPSDDLLNKLNDQVTTRTEQLVKFLETGGLLVYFLCRPFNLHGPNTSIDNYLWLLSLAPDQSSEKNTRNMSAVAHGRNIEPTSEATDSEFYPYLQLKGLEWNTVIRTDNLTEGYTTLATAGPKKCISAELYAGDNAGRIVFLPAPYSPDFDKTLLECANLWYQRKVGNEVSLEEVKQAIEESGIAKLKPETERVHITQVEAAKEELMAQDLAQMDKSLVDKDTLSRPASRSRTNMPAQQPGARPGHPLPKMQSSTNIPAAKPGGPGPNPNGPLKGGPQPGIAKQGMSKTESGLVVPKLDQSSTSHPKVTAPGGAGGTTPGKGLGAIVPPTGNKPRDPARETLAGLAYRQEGLSSELQALRSQAQAERSSAAEMENLLKQQQAASSGSSQSSGVSKAENLLRELEQLNRGDRSGEANKARALPPSDIERPSKMTTQPLGVGVEEERIEERTEERTEERKPAAAQQSPKAPVIATWASDYIVSGLEHVTSERDSILERIKELQEQISTMDERLKIIEEIKTILLSSEGAQLVMACKKALTTLGWNAQPSAASESELVLSSQDKPEALVRVIRSETQTNRTDFAGLIESITAFWEEHDLEPKGILLSCTWANTPPSDRTGPDHSPGLAEFAQKKNLCLITTVQLLGLFRDLQLKRQTAAEIRRKLVSTSGMFEGHSVDSVLSRH
jgi:hypothetical protein